MDSRPTVLRCTAALLAAHALELFPFNFAYRSAGSRLHVQFKDAGVFLRLLLLLLFKLVYACVWRATFCGITFAGDMLN